MNKPMRDEAVEMDWREKIIEDFRTWLYALTDMPDQEATASLSSVAPVQTPDLQTLFGELAALRQEIKLQTKTAHKTGKDLAETGRSLADETKQTLAKIQADKASFDSGHADLMLTELLLVRDALGRSLDAVEAYRLAPEKIAVKPWLKKAFLGLEHAYGALARIIKKLDDALYQLDVFPVADVGRPFDAACMRAVAVSGERQYEPGMVSLIVHQGYRHKDRIIRVAEVEVEK